MEQKLCKAWVTDLREHPELQGNYALRKEHTGGDLFCCLGRLCVVAGITQWVQASNGRGLVPLGARSSTLSPELRGRFGLSNEAANLLIDMNDNEGKDFLTIADWIEENLCPADQTQPNQE